MKNDVGLLFLLFMNANQYFQATNIINSIQSVFLISSVFMIMFRKDGKGLHDFISNTKVFYIIQSFKKEK